jgi:acyl-CoA thioester hydrolase
MDHAIGEYPVVIEIPVVWGEMDAFLHVNNIVYFRYFESARIAYFERLDVLDFMNQKGVGPILASTACRFRIPLSYPDKVLIGARVTGIEADRFLMHYLVRSERHGKTAAEGDGLIVAFNYRESRKAAIPDELRKRIIALEKTKGNALK